MEDHPVPLLEPVPSPRIGFQIAGTALSTLAGYFRSGATAQGRLFTMNNSAKSLALAAAFAGLLGGTTVRLNAQPVSQSNNGTSAQSSAAGVLLVGQDAPALPKHSCKGKNDCKGQGGGKHPGKNDCKGKGGCATDGSKPPKVA